jgi:hypothetical protein
MAQSPLRYIWKAVCMEKEEEKEEVVKVVVTRILQ